MELKMEKSRMFSILKDQIIHLKKQDVSFFQKKIQVFQNFMLSQKPLWSFDE